MKCFTFHDQQLLEGIQVIGKEDPCVFLGEKGPRSLYQVIKLDRQNLPFIKNGVLKYAFPIKKKHITDDGLKMERIYLGNPFRSKDKILVRVLTSTSGGKKRKDGRWYRLISKELEVRGKKFFFPSIVSKGRGVSPKQSTSWVDELLIMPHGTAIKVIPEGSIRSEEVVIGNIHGTAFYIDFENFNKAEFEELSNFSREEFLKRGKEPEDGNVEEPEASDKEFDDEVTAVLEKLDLNSGNVAEGESELEATLEGVGSDSSALLHKADGSAVL